MAAEHSAPGVAVLVNPREKRDIANAAAIKIRPVQIPAIVVQDKDSLAAAMLIDDHVATLANGSADAYDWTPLHQRDVYIWPTPGDKYHKSAAKFAESLIRDVKSVSVVINQPHTLAGASGELVPYQLAEIIKQHAKPVTERVRNHRSKQQSAGRESEPKSAPLSWAELKLDSEPGKPPHVNLINVSTILQRDPNYAGRIWLDTFRDKIYYREVDKSRLWKDSDTRRAAAYIQKSLQLPKVGTLLVHEAVQHAAEANAENSVIQWIERLPAWDRTHRLHDWLTDTLGVEKTEYTMAVAHNWPIAMVARAYQPGCKFDHMPVLEGEQGLAKTSFLEVLGGEWYKSLPMAFGDKDFLQAIQGAWIVEIPDMTGFSRREHGAILATITIRVDEYRKSYGRTTESHPRVAMFAATSETDDYLKDTRGRRRYWPLRCQAINLPALAQMRSQIFAEALARYRAGEPYWIMPASADAEQMDRSEPDPWAPDVVDQAEIMWLKGLGDAVTANITATRILAELGVLIKDQNQSTRERVGAILKENGWRNKRTRNARLWFKPSR